MKLCTFIQAGKQRIGVAVADDAILDIQAACKAVTGAERDAYASMLNLLDAGPEALDHVRQLVGQDPAAARLARKDVEIIAPIPIPRAIRGFSLFPRHLVQGAVGLSKILSEGLKVNAEASAVAAAQMAGFQSRPPERPMPDGYYAEPSYGLFHTSIGLGPDATVEWPAYSDWVDYELEVVAVTGQAGKDLSPAQWKERIVGYMLMNDLSARDAQFKAAMGGAGPTGKGKEFDGGFGFGPYIVTADEVPDPYHLMVTTKVNGEVWHSGRVEEEPVWKFEDCLAFVSRSQTIAPGELSSSGCTPSCSSIEQVRVVNRGDVVEFEAEHLGSLRVRIV